MNGSSYWIIELIFIIIIEAVQIQDPRRHHACVFAFDNFWAFIVLPKCHKNELVSRFRSQQVIRRAKPWRIRNRLHNLTFKKFWIWAEKNHASCGLLNRFSHNDLDSIVSHSRICTYVLWFSNNFPRYIYYKFSSVSIVYVEVYVSKWHRSVI
jgi:hypothetical protein